VRYKANRKCPVIALTACVDSNTTKKAIKVGMKEVLSKPISTIELTRILRKYYFN
jgi:CheY-like chemotaxis protein